MLDGLRDWQLTQALPGWTLAEIDETPGWRLDRLLAVGEVVGRAREEMRDG